MEKEKIDLVKGKYNKQVVQHLERCRQKENYSDALEYEMCSRLKALGFENDDDGLILIIKARVATYRSQTKSEIWFVLDPKSDTPQHLVGFDYKRLKILRIIGSK